MIEDELKKKIQILSEKAWEKKLDWPAVETWLENFNGKYEPQAEERLHALYLLTQNLYFGQELIREMLSVTYEQLYKYPILQKIRKENSDTLDENIIEPLFADLLGKTRFLGVGNPSESGPHLLYYFRQINNLPKNLFIDSSEILSISRDNDDSIDINPQYPDVEKYVFIDDVLGSGSQIRKYLFQYLRELRRSSPNVEIKYFALFATTEGLREARKPELFDGNVECIFELDESFKCFETGSRCFKSKPSQIDRDVARKVAESYGQDLCPGHPLGYKDGQLLLALSHNTPDNSLPIIWFDAPEILPWSPIFKRYHKVY